MLHRMAELTHISRGLWRDAADVATLPGRAAALLSVLPAGTVISGITAAQIHGLWLPSLDNDVLEFIVHADTPIPRKRPGSRRKGLRARRQLLEPDEVTVVEGLPVTTEAVTWLHLAGRLKPADLVAAGDSALRGGASLGELDIVVGRAVHRPGVVRARQVLPMLDARSRSRPESHLRFTVVSAGLPKPAVNQPVFDEHGQWLAEPDLSYDDVRLALEYNGAYHAGVERMRADITRGVDLGLRGGWQTVTFGPNEVFRFPDRIAPYVAALRRERARLFR